ncbi:MAG: hypothetical protein ACETWC_06120 [Acidobacteriota bacterium]
MRFAALILAAAYILFVSSFNYTHSRFHQQNRLVTSASREDVLFDRFFRYHGQGEEGLVSAGDYTLIMICPFALLMNNLVSSLSIASIPSIDFHPIYVIKEVLRNTPSLTAIYGFFSRAPPLSC